MLARAADSQKLFKGGCDKAQAAAGLLQNFTVLVTGDFVLNSSETDFLIV